MNVILCVRGDDMIRLCSFDVWNTLLDLDEMLKLFAESLSELMNISDKEIFRRLMNVRGRIKEERKKGVVPATEVLEYSQNLLAQSLGVDVEIVKRAAAKATLKTNERIILRGVKETLRNLKERGFRIVALGNVMLWPSAYSRMILEAEGISDYIDKQFYSDELNTYKPMRDMFLKPLKEFSIKPYEAIHVGDTKAEDYEGALKAGLYAAWISPKSEMKRISERGFVIPSISEMEKVLEEIERRE